jgi:hypothetical protein
MLRLDHHIDKTLVVVSRGDPREIVSFDPGLRGTSCPGTRGRIAVHPIGVTSALSRGVAAAPLGLMPPHYVWQGNRLVHWFRWSDRPGGARRLSAWRVCAQRRCRVHFLPYPDAERLVGPSTPPVAPGVVRSGGWPRQPVGRLGRAHWIVPSSTTEQATTTPPQRPTAAMRDSIPARGALQSRRL